MIARIRHNLWEYKTLTDLLLRINKDLLEFFWSLLNKALRMFLYVLRIVTVARRDHVKQIFNLIVNKFRMRRSRFHL